MHESGEMYLEAILVLQKKTGFVRAVDVGEYLGYSKPSVSRGLSILRKGGYVQCDASGELHLTESGRDIAEKIYERHVYLTRLLVAAGVPEDIAAADACKLEHSISDVSFEALKKFIKSLNP